MYDTHTHIPKGSRRLLSGNYRPEIMAFVSDTSAGKLRRWPIVVLFPSSIH